MLVCLVRNGEEHLPSFLRHYRGLGVEQFVFVDNGSDDATLGLLDGQPGVTVYTTDLAHKHYECQMRRWIIERHCRGGWCLNVDADELFDYPFSDRVPFARLLEYLRGAGATAVVGYMLDMFARENEFGAAADTDLKRAYPYYDISAVEKRPYHTAEVRAYCDRNVLSLPEIGCYFGGIRETLFPSRRGAEYLLTKHPLLFLDGDLTPVTHPHYSNGARIADVSAVVQHYKFTRSFRDKVAESRASNRYVKFAQHQYEQYHRRIGGERVMLVETPGTQRLKSVDELLRQGFVHAGPQYRRFASAEPARRLPQADRVSGSRR